MEKTKVTSGSGGKGCFSPEQLSFSGSPCGSEILKDRVEKLIHAFNSTMEESQQRTEILKKTVMREAATLVAKYEEAQAKKMEKVTERMNTLIENLGSDLKKMETEEEELKKFSSSLGLFFKDMPR